ncbi:MAG: MFS transporter [Deltaproteobacteria bacterium]|nr:MFS transporter [Deltaproteobacteria bacterium]MBI3295602.1 MFS transporter [Deltaproteobacteria bacterium]
MILNLTVIVGALGYFVDIYDLVLFSIVRIQSLTALGVPPSELLPVGVRLINCQMVGMLIGGLVWGILGDKKGRVSVLFGSILLYSVANILNAFVQNLEQYAVLRFVAGLGLAGELGAAITLVSEVLPKETRGYGTAVVAGVGLSGAVFAGIVGDLLSWRIAYLSGGLFGFLLLLLRLQLLESGLFKKAGTVSITRGSLWMILKSRERLLKLINCTLIGVPIWFFIGIIVTFAPEITQALGAREDISSGRGILFGYAGIAIGDLLSGSLSQWIGSRKKVVGIFLTAYGLLVAITLLSHGFGAQYFYSLCFLMGLFTGYWAVFVTISAEQFGTNLRATVATSVPNFVRGSVVIMTSSFRNLALPLGTIGAAATVGGTAIALGFIALFFLPETHAKELDYFER